MAKSVLSRTCFNEFWNTELSHVKIGSSKKKKKKKK